MLLPVLRWCLRFGERWWRCYITSMVLGCWQCLFCRERIRRRNPFFFSPEASLQLGAPALRLGPQNQSPVTGCVSALPLRLAAADVSVPSAPVGVRGSSVRFRSASTRLLSPALPGAPAPSRQSLPGKEPRFPGRGHRFQGSVRRRCR